LVTFLFNIYRLFKIINITYSFYVFIVSFFFNVSYIYVVNDFTLWSRLGIKLASFLPLSSRIAREMSGERPEGRGKN